MRHVRLLGLALVLVLLASACGQKSGVALSSEGRGGGQGESAAGDPSGDLIPEEGEPTDTVPDETTDTAPGTPGSVAPGGGSSGGGGAGGAGRGGGGGGGATATTAPRSGGGGGGGGGSGGVAAGPNDKNGVTDKELVIGIHAPVTGAAPFPQSTFEEGRDVYWKEKGPVHGRQVRVVFYDDQFNPSRAVQVCRQMVEKDKVFLLVGGGGADQITACAKYANQVNVPYMSAGVNERGLESLKTYFALSLTYAQQSPILAQLVKNRLGKTKIGVVVSDTPSFADAHASFLRSADQAKLEVVYNEKISKTASQSETLAHAQGLQRADAEAVYVLTTPTVFVQLAQQANGQGYRPIWFGPGITSGLNTVAAVGCPAIADARFLSPFMQLDDPASNEYKAAYRKHNGKEGDDIGFALWGLNAMLADMLRATGPDLGRAKFMSTLQSGQPFSGGIFPEAKYAPGKPFGGSAMALLRADCGSRRYVTEAKNVSGF